jgi:hypothetical protein
MNFRLFSTFSVVVLVLDRPECSSSSTDTLPAMKRAIPKILSGLKNVLEKPHDTFQGFW